MAAECQTRLTVSTDTYRTKKSTSCVDEIKCLQIDNKGN